MVTQKMQWFAIIAQEEVLTRNEMQVWLHRSYGGSANPAHISQKPRIPPRFAEKGMIRDGRVL